jgi:hypothetical protein
MNLRRLIHKAKESGKEFYSLQFGDCQEFKWEAVPMREKTLQVLTDTEMRQYILDNSDLLYNECYCLSITKDSAGWIMNVNQTEFESSAQLTPRQDNLYNEEEQ